MQWSFTGDTPVYQQVIEQLRLAVLSGTYPPGTKLPSVRELAAQARINPNTVQRAMLLLEQEGLLLTRGTTGRFVTEDDRIIEDLRVCHRQTVVRRCMRQLADVGLTLREAAEMEEN